MNNTPVIEPPAPVILHCANHPTVETSLRCNNCEKPICPRCAKLTPTGYRCKECISGQQKVFDTTEWWDYPVAFVAAGLLSFAGSYLAGLIGWFIIFLAPIFGLVIAEVVRFVTRKRRSPMLYRVAAVGTALGALPLLLISLAGALFGFGYGGMWSLIFQAAYVFMVTSGVYYRLGGISMR